MSKLYLLVCYFNIDNLGKQIYHNEAWLIFGLFFIVFLSFLGGLIISPYLFTQNNENVIKEIRKSYSYKYINPLLECENSTISQDKNLTSLKKSVEFIINQQIINNKISFASVYYRDLNNGPWMGINEKEYFSPASLIKVPVMMAYLKEAEEDPSILEKKIINSKAFDYSQQNVTPTEILQLDKEYTVEDLLEKMIIYSEYFFLKFRLPALNSRLLKLPLSSSVFANCKSVPVALLTPAIPSSARSVQEILFELGLF